MKQYTKEELDVFKSQLLAIQKRLRGDVSTISRTVNEKNNQIEMGSLSSSPIHLAEAGTDNFEQEFTYTLLEVGVGHLREIEAALARIEDGTYGICEECGSRITKKRLQAIPYTNLCINCTNARSCKNC